MGRTVLFGAIAIAVILAALALNYSINRENATTPAADSGADAAAERAATPAVPAGESPTPDAADASSAPKPQVAALPGADAAATATAPPQPGEAPPPVGVPAFDIVRVNPTGEMVIAGRAEPGSEVTLTIDGRAGGTVRADRRGEWVLLPERPLEPGSHELGLTATGGSATPKQSDQVVVVVVPEPSKDIAGRTAVDGAGEPLAVLVPREGQGSRVLQMPAMAAEAVGPLSPPEAAATDEAGDDAADRVAALAAPDPVGPAGAAAPAASLEGGAALEPVEIAPARAFPEGIADGALTLESVDYDREGNVVIGGRTAPGRTVQVYLDNQLVGRAVAADSGHWQVRPTAPVPEGLHRLRVDEVEADGAVTARVESPFARAELLDQLPGDSFVIVQPGNSLWRIARRVYGKGVRYTVIYHANRPQIADPDLIYPGQVFALPPGSALAN